MNMSIHNEQRIQSLVDAVIIASVGGGCPEISRALAGSDREEILEVLSRFAASVVATAQEQPALFGPGRVCDFAIEHAAEQFGVTAEAIRSDSRLRTVSDARSVAMYVAREAGLTLGDIGHGFDKDRTGVMYAVNKAANQPRLLAAAEQVASQLHDALASSDTKTTMSVPVPAAEPTRHLRLVPDHPEAATPLLEPGVPDAPAGLKNRSVFEQALELAAATFGLEPEQLLSEDRTRRVADARLVAMGALRMSDMTLPAIARPFDRDHTTVLKNLRRLETTPPLKAYAEQVFSQLQPPAVAGVDVDDLSAPAVSAPSRPRLEPVTAAPAPSVGIGR